MNPVRTSVLEAVTAVLTEDELAGGALSRALPGGVWTGEIPEGLAVPLPAAAVDATGAGWEFTTEGPDLERTRLAVAVFAESAAAVDALLDRLQAFLFAAEFAFAGADELVYFVPDGRATRAETLRSPAGQTVFAGDLAFDCALFRH